MQYATLLATLLAAATAVGAVPALEQRTQTCYKTEYYCDASEPTTLQCCNFANSVGGTAKIGCSPYDNNSSPGPCDASEIYCCDMDVLGTAINCEPAAVEQMQISCN